MILTNKNDIGVFFEVIEELEPHRVLDIGMFLKRIGCVSRQVMEIGSLEEVILDGIDVFPEVDFPIWKKIYNRIWCIQEFFNNSISDKYDIAVMLGTTGLGKKYLLPVLVETVKGTARYLLIDRLDDEWVNKFSSIEIKELKMEEDIYYLVDFGE